MIQLHSILIVQFLKTVGFWLKECCKRTQGKEYRWMIFKLVLGFSDANKAAYRIFQLLQGKSLKRKVVKSYWNLDSLSKSLPSLFQKDMIGRSTNQWKITMVLEWQENFSNRNQKSYLTSEVRIIVWIGSHP